MSEPQPLDPGLSDSSSDTPLTPHVTSSECFHRPLRVGNQLFKSSFNFLMLCNTNISGTAQHKISWVDRSVHLRETLAVPQQLTVRHFCDGAGLTVIIHAPYGKEPLVFELLQNDHIIRGLRAFPQCPREYTV